MSDRKAVLQVYRVMIIVMLLIGVTHISLVFRSTAWIPETFWFTGTGLALIFCGLLNVVNRETDTILTFRCALASNVLVLVLGGIMAVRLALHIPSITVTLTAAVLLVFTLILNKKTKNDTI